MIRVRLLVAVATGCVAAIFVYALLRALQLVSGGEANPATVIVRSQHLAYLWRAWTSLFGGALVAACAYFASARHLLPIARALGPALVVAVLALAVQATVLP